ncbi:hypothetical protein D1007_52682 [Hordeum vulgare]|nr:hypothetical protein D1007_52682 [Hordeum vulgare]
MAEAIHAEGQRESVEEKAAHTCARAEKEVLAMHCEETEAILKALQERVAETQQLQLWEEDVRTGEVKLADRNIELTKVVAEQATDCGLPEAATDRVALSSLELRARQALSSICRLELESPLIPQGTSYAELSSKIVKDLEGIAMRVDDILEEECRNHLFVAATCVFRHLLLRDPRFKFYEVMGLVPEESNGNLVAVVEGHVITLLGKFFCGDGEDPDKDPPIVILK